MVAFTAGTAIQGIGLASSLFGGKKGKKSGGGALPPQQTFTPVGINTPDLQIGFNKGSNTFDITNEQASIDRAREANNLGLRSASELRGLREELRPGFGRLTTSRVAALDANRQRTIGNVRDTLAQRRLSGSRFAADTIASAEAEFALKEDQIRAESFLQELGASTELIDAEFKTALQGLQTLMAQHNFNVSQAASLAQTAMGAQVSFANSQNALQGQMAALQAESQAGKGKAFGELIGVISKPFENTSFSSLFGGGGGGGGFPLSAFGGGDAA